MLGSKPTAGTPTTPRWYPLVPFPLMGNRIQVKLRLHPDTLDQLRDEAAHRQTSVNYLITQAVEDWIALHAHTLYRGDIHP